MLVSSVQVLLPRQAQTPDTMYTLRAVKQCADISQGTTHNNMYTYILSALPMTLLDVKTGGAFDRESGLRD